MRLHLVSRHLLSWKLRPLSKVVDVVIRLLCAARVPAEASIDPSVTFSHNGLAVLITREARIARGCQIGTHVVLGSNWPKAGAPNLEENVIVGPGAIILGPVTLGRGCVIAAGAVVLSDVPSGSMVAGSAATVKKEAVDSSFYRYPAA